MIDIKITIERIDGNGREGRLSRNYSFDSVDEAEAHDWQRPVGEMTRTLYDHD